jgi:phosphoserine phosphatase
MTLVVFDFDGALTGADPTVLLGREYDVAAEIQGLATEARRGDIGVGESLRQRVALLEGMPEGRVEGALRRCKLRDGAGDLISSLRRSDVQVAVVTRGFDRAVEAALDRAGVSVDHLVANHLVVAAGALTGEIDGSLVDGGKDRALEELAAATGVDRSRIVAVGDTESDLPMLRAAGTAVGFDPDPVVEPHCDVVVPSIHKLRLYFEQHGIIARAESGA